MLEELYKLAFGLTEPDHGSDASHEETHAVRETRDGVEGWLVNGEKMWIIDVHAATHYVTFVRTDGKDGDAKGIIALLIPSGTPGGG